MSRGLLIFFWFFFSWSSSPLTTYTIPYSIFYVKYKTAKINIRNILTIVIQHAITYNRRRLLFEITVTPILHEWLHDRGWTQQKLADETGIPQGTISKFAKNERFSIKHLFAISRALNVSIEDLFIVSESPDNSDNWSAKRLLCAGSKTLWRCQIFWRFLCIFYTLGPFSPVP